MMPRQNPNRSLTTQQLHNVVKVAEPYSSFQEAVEAATANAAQQQALRDALYLGGAGMGAGMAFRGLSGLFNLKRRASHTEYVPDPNIITMPLPEEQKKKRRSLKTAADRSFLKGDFATNSLSVPWALPLSVAAGGAGAFAGWKALDYILDKQRKNENEQEVLDARKEYEAALNEMSHSKLGTALDNLFDKLHEKKAALADWAGKATGAYGLYAGLSGALAAYMAYNWAKKHQRRSLLDRAKKQRQTLWNEQQPAPIYAHPPGAIEMTHSKDDVPEDPWAE